MTLCVMLVLAMRVSAAGVEAQPVVRRPRLRVVTVSGGAEEVRVAARTATRLRFDTSLDAERIRLVEPLLVGHGFLVRVRNPDPLAGSARTEWSLRGSPDARRAVCGVVVVVVSPEDVMETNKRTYLKRWMLAMGVAAVLASGAAYALRKECWNCSPCGCSSDGGYILCCDASAC